MKIVIYSVLLTLVLFCGACTSSEKDTSPTTVSPSTSHPRIAEFTLPYEATQDTEWNSNPAGPSSQTGAIKKGEQVMLARDPDPSVPIKWVLAKLKDRSVRYVRPHHFRKV